MKKSVFLLILALSTFVILNAHPAGSLKTNFDPSTSILKVDFNHKVKNEADHFIYDIEVKLNGKKLIHQELLKQENKEGGSVLYKLSEAKSGDKIQIITECNKGGKKTETIEVK